jgi:apolipoprotein N-acyltransferase
MCAVAGICLAGSVPPWGWWPLAFVGFAIVDRLLVQTTGKQRFRRMWAVGVWWLGPAMLWMVDLTPPGYLVAVLLYAAYYGIAAALTPADRRRRWVFPGAFALAELARWYWPFGGVPLANVALSQVDSPIGQTARLFGPLFVIILTIVIGQGLAAAVVERESRAPRMAAGLVALALLGAWIHPRAEVVDELDVAVVQGGGPTRTRASSDQQPVVLARHIEATQLITSPVDLILWPENVVNPGRFLDFDDAAERVSGVAVQQEATLLPGWFYPVNDGTATVNYHTAIAPDGEEVARYDKVRIVPFGEYVPLRGLIEQFSSEIPSRDVIRGTGPAVLDTPVGVVGVAISWEAYFERRSRDSIRNGAELLVNPTNGSSYWLTQVHTQQVASNQLRAIENDRWLLMAGPTGLSAVVDPDGRVVQRTDIGERAVLEDTVELRTGRTLASLVGFWPVLIYGLVVIGRALLQRSSADQS